MNCTQCDADNCTGCESWDPKTGRPCCCGQLQFSDADIAEERLAASNYTAWAAL